MKKSKYTESQIVFALHKAQIGTPFAEVCRKMGISQSTGWYLPEDRAQKSALRDRKKKGG